MYRIIQIGCILRSNLLLKHFIARCGCLPLVENYGEKETRKSTAMLLALAMSGINNAIQGSFNKLKDVTIAYVNDFVTKYIGIPPLYVLFLCLIYMLCLFVLYCV